MATWSAPEAEVTIGATKRRGTVARMVVSAYRDRPVATADLTLANQRFGWSGLVAEGDAVEVAWGYSGFTTADPASLQKIFGGTVAQFFDEQTMRVIARCKAAALLETVTGSYARIPASEVVRSLVSGCGFADLDIAQVDEPLEVLPLHGETILDAIKNVNRGMGLEHAYWCSPDGVFHWRPEDLEQEASFSFSVYRDAISFRPVYGGRTEIVVQGNCAWHSIVVEVENWQREKERHFVEGVKHMIGVGGAGTRTLLTTRKIP